MNILDSHDANINASFIHAHGFSATALLLSKMALKGNEFLLELGFGTG